MTVFIYQLSTTLKYGFLQIATKNLSLIYFNLTSYHGSIYIYMSTVVVQGRTTRNNRYFYGVIDIRQISGYFCGVDRDQQHAVI